MQRVQQSSGSKSDKSEALVKKFDDTKVQGKVARLREVLANANKDFSTKRSINFIYKKSFN